MSSACDYLFGWFADSKEEPLSAIFTTFNFDPEYFDLIFLPTMLQMKLDGGITSGAQYLSLMDKLQRTPIAVIADGNVNLKAAQKVYGYDLQPVMDRRQHSKVFLVEYESSVRMVVGSANLSVAGMHENREITTALSIERGSSHWHLLRDAVEFVSSIGDPKYPNLVEAVDRLRKKVRSFRSPETDWDMSVQFIGLSSPDHQLNLSDQATTFLDRFEFKKRARMIRSITVVSPYFEDPKSPVESLITSVLNDAESFNRDAIKTEILRPDLAVYVPTSGDIIVTKFPKDTYIELLETDESSITFHSNSTALATKSERPRFPHGKLYLVKGESYTLVIGGSSNFSRSGFGLAGPKSNIEANIAYFYPQVKHGIFKSLTPEGNELDLRKAIEVTYDAENPDVPGQTPVVVQATFDRGTLTVHLSQAGVQNEHKFRIDQTHIDFGWHGNIGIQQLDAPTHHVLGVFDSNGAVVQYFPIFFADGSFNPLKTKASREELESWIEARYLTAKDLPFPGLPDVDPVGEESIAAAPSKTLRAVNTDQYVVYRAREFTRLLSGVTAKLAPIKDFAKRLDYHLGEEFGLINLVRRYLATANDDKETILGPYCAGELVTAVIHATDGQSDGSAIAIREVFKQQVQTALEQYVADSGSSQQVTDYLSIVLSLLVTDTTSGAEEPMRSPA